MARVEAAHVRGRQASGSGDGGRAGAAGGRPAEPLGKYANKSSPGSRKPHLTPGERRKRRNQHRRERYRLRYRLRQITNLSRVKDCGHVTIMKGNSGPALRLGVTKSGRVAGLSGLAHCGSVWACPACSAKIATRRAEELADVMRHALEQGCSASMASLTMKHNKGHTLADCWSAVSYAWAAVTSGKQWTEDQAMAGLVGWVKAVEVTQGKNGWHVHLHVLMIWRGQIGLDAAEAVSERMWARWSRALRRFKPKNGKAGGFDSLRKDSRGHDVGLDVRLASLEPGLDNTGLHQYFVKLSHEITGGHGKIAKGSGRTPFQLLTDALDTGLADDLERWWEWERASRGRRQIAWSKDLREWAKLGREQSDEEIAEEELPGEDVLLIEPDAWWQLRREPDKVCELLEAAERAGFPGASGLLDRWGLGWMHGTSAPPPMGPLMRAAYKAFPRQWSE